MNDLALKVFAKTVQVGSVYRFIDHSDTELKPHFFVILNSHPLEAPELVFVYATSKVEKKRRILRYYGYHPDTMIEVGPKDCPFLTLPSVFDCNNLKKFSIEKIVYKLDRSEIQYVCVVDTGILKRLQKGVLISRAVSKDVKELI